MSQSRHWLFLAVWTLFAWTGRLPAQVLFPEGSDWRYLKGTAPGSQPDTTAWRGPSFDDSSWAVGKAAFY